MNDKLQIDEIDEFTTASRIHGTPNALGERVEIAANGQIFTRGFIGVVASLGVPPKQRSLVREQKYIASVGLRCSLLFVIVMSKKTIIAHAEPFVWQVC